MKKLIIIGASGFGREVAWLVERINKQIPTWDLLGFLDDNPSIVETTVNGYKVLGTTSDIMKYSDTYFICAIGSSQIRKKVVKKCKNLQFAKLIDPSVEISELTEVGEGSIICAHSIITVNVKIGTHAIINLDCTIGHDSILDDFVTLYPSVNVSGNTVLGECSEIGTGSQIIQGRTIGRRTIVGAGAVVIKDLPNDCTAIGVPAKPIKFNEGRNGD